MNIKPRICQQKWQLEYHNVSNYYSSIPIMRRICGENCLFLFSLNQLRQKLHSKFCERKPGNVTIAPNSENALLWLNHKDQILISHFGPICILYCTLQSLCFQFKAALTKPHFATFGQYNFWARMLKWSLFLFWHSVGLCESGLSFMSVRKFGYLDGNRPV